MFGTKSKPKTTTVANQDYVTIGQRFGNLTVKKHYQVDYPQNM